MHILRRTKQSFVLRRTNDRIAPQILWILTKLSAYDFRTGRSLIVDTVKYYYNVLGILTTFEQFKLIFSVIIKMGTF